MNDNANETEFHQRADATLDALFAALEDADAQGLLEMEYENGILHVELASGKEYILSKHAPSRQLWLSSPISGGLHFSYVAGQWALADGRQLFDVLNTELHRLAGLKVAL